MVSLDGITRCGQYKNILERSMAVMSSLCLMAPFKEGTLFSGHTFFLVLDCATEI